MDVVLEKPKTGVELAEALLVDPEQRRRLCIYARTRFGIAGADVEDVLQETALQVLRTHGPIRRPNGFVFQLFHIRCCEHLQRTTAHRALAAHANARGIPVPAERPRDTADDCLALRQGMARISPMCRRLLKAYYLEGKSLRETAAEMAVANGSVWHLVNRCLWRLKKCLER